MTTFEKLEAILACVQTDAGNRGLACDPVDNLFTATAGDFERACRSIVEHRHPIVALSTGFYIPTATPPAFETDGPLGLFFLQRTLQYCGIPALPYVNEVGVLEALNSARDYCCLRTDEIVTVGWSHVVIIEQSGPGSDGRHYSMRGRDVTQYYDAKHIQNLIDGRDEVTIGIGDGGNEIGMGKIPHETIVKNIPNGDLIHCRVPTDHLIVAGVSNWGAYALAAGVYVLRNEKPPANLFNPDYERKILQVMVDAGPLVDGVTGKQEATVDGLSWDEYVKPLIRMREILER